VASPYADEPCNGRPPIEPEDGLDVLLLPTEQVWRQRYDHEDIPTSPWMFRALCEHILAGKDHLSQFCCLEPACGRMYAADTLWEYFSHVKSSDKLNWGYGDIVDFVDDNTYRDNEFDWVITNPPYKLIPQFATQAHRIARRGVAMLISVDRLGSEERYEKLYKILPPNLIIVHPERPGTAPGYIVESSSETKYFCWLLWDKVNDPAIRRINFMPMSKDYLTNPDKDYPQEPRGDLFPSLNKFPLTGKLKNMKQKIGK
jgi:hypothetical protein